MTNSHKNIINPFLESSTLLIMTFPEIVESKDLLCGRTCAVDNVRARRKGVLGKLYEIQISPERGLRNSLKFPSYFGMEYVRPWNMGKKLLEKYVLTDCPSLYTHTCAYIYIYMYIYMHIRTYIYVLFDICTFICINIHKYVYIHTYVYIYIYI